MSDIVDFSFADYEKGVEKKKKDKEKDDVVENHEIEGDPPEPPSPSSSSSSYSSSHSHHSNCHQKNDFKNTLLKLDVKFNFHMFNGETNADKLNNWIK
jgi:hypothetical protein